LGEFRFWLWNGGAIPSEFAHETIMAGSIGHGLDARKKLLPIG
jgi:hypothetical protein